MKKSEYEESKHNLVFESQRNAGFFIWCLMNIQTAASYANHGYRIRRASWNKDDVIGKSDGFFWHCYTMKSSDGRKHRVSISYVPNIDDLMADDWELILKGISSDYGQVKYREKKKK